MINSVVLNQTVNQNAAKVSNSNNSRPILVTGSHRSGSTWAGKILSAAPGVAYVHEPFNLLMPFPAGAKPVDYWFQHFCEENADEYRPVFKDILQYRYPLKENIARIRTVRDFAKVLKDQGLFLRYRLANSRPMIKDPIAFFSAEWLSRTFGMDVLVMIRHPAAFCASIKLKNWAFDFRQFLGQPLLMEGYLQPFREQIAEYSENEQPVIEQAILLWNCIHCTIVAYQEKHPEWIFVRHEDLSMDPVGQFEAIFSSLDLEFGEKARRFILESSGEHNPVERSGYEVTRNSRANVKSWQSRLTAAEIALVREKTLEYSPGFYRDNDWA